jgi:hypothetical protein
LAGQNIRGEENYVRRHAKATLAGSTFGRGFGLASIRSARAFRDASLSDDGSGAPSRDRVRMSLLALVIATVAVLAVGSSTAMAALTRIPTGFSPITGSGIGTTIKSPSGLAVDESNGNIFLNDGGSANAIDIFGAEGGHPVGVASPYRITGFNFEGSEPTGIDIDHSSPPSVSHGAIYTTDIANSKIKKFVRNPGTELYEAAGELVAGPGEEPLDEPLGLAVDKKGDVFVSDFFPPDIIEFGPTGTELKRFDATPTVGFPSALAFDAAGDLFVESYSNSSVYEYPANGSGEIEPSVHTKVLNANSGARGIAVNTATNRLFISFGNHVNEYDAATLTKTMEFGANFLSGASRVAVNASTGRIYVSNGSPASIVVFGDPVTIPTVETTAATEVSIGKATLNGSVNPENIAVTECKFEYGTSTAYGHEASCEGAIPTDGNEHEVSAKLTGLLGETQFHFRIVATNANGKSIGTDKTFVTPAAVLVSEATNLTGTHATLHGTDFPANLAVTECKFEYGQNFSFNHSVPCAQAIPTDDGEHNVSAAVNHLLPNGAFYQFRLAVTNSEGTFRSATGFFSTPETTKTSPASNRTTTAAKLNGTVDPDEVALTECKFEWGPTNSYGNSVPCTPAFGSIPADTNTHAVSASIGGLTPSSAYHYRLVTATVDGVSKGQDVLFHSLGPLLEKVAVSFPSMTSTTATIEALVNPQGQGTSYRFEYVTQAQFDESGYAAAEVAPKVVTGVGHGEENVQITQLITGLTPATHYHVRIVINSLGGTVTGPDLTFATFPKESLPTPGSCSNEKFRTEASASLPDCRAYEQASPIDKDGTDVGGDMWHTAVSPNGDAVLMQDNSGIPGGTGTLQFPTFVARRGATNWSTTGTLIPPQFGERGGINAFTPDLKLFFNDATRVGVHSQASDIIHDLPNGTYQEIFPYQNGFGVDFNYIGASTDDSELFFDTRFDSVPVTSGPGPASTSSFRNNSYVFEPETGELTLAGVLPAAEGGQAPVGGSEIGSSSYFNQAHHAMSTNGDQVVFTAGSPDALYLRKGLGGANPETVKVSESEKTNGGGPGGTDSHGPLPAYFWDATPDGKLIFFTSQEELTNNANTGPTAAGSDLYAYDTESEELTDLTVDNGDVNGAGVQGVVGVSEEGNRIYFGANGDLDGGGPAVAGNCHQSSEINWTGSCSLYLWEEGEITFIAPLHMSSNDWALWQQAEGPGFGNPPQNRIPAGMVSADGSSIVFRTSQQLTNYDNEGTGEYYRYHVGEPGVLCITCSPTGAPENGTPQLSSVSIGASQFGTQPFILRNLSASGNQFFFETTDKLVPSDTNGDVKCPFSGGFNFDGPDCQDVYEWEADGAGSCHAEGGLGGCYYLVSTGKEATPAFFSDASTSGNDVMIFSHLGLVPQDQDSLADIYDASVGGGLAAQHPVTPPHCEGEGCREEVTSPPGSNGAGTAVFEGPENPAPKCSKGYVKQHGECVKKKKAHKHHKRGHHRHANKTRRTSR